MKSFVILNYLSIIKILIYYFKNIMKSMKIYKYDTYAIDILLVLKVKIIMLRLYVYNLLLSQILI